MDAYEIRDLSFTYPGGVKPALSHIHLDIGQGEMVVLCGQSGCGKTTLLRNLKTVLAPFGNRTGEIRYFGRDLDQVSPGDQAKGIGYVLQDPDNQLVTDKVWHELAFGLENLGMDSRTIRLRVAEMASFFGIQSWFDRNVNQLSGGQKQILNLASVMIMQPEVLVLDEPTSQLDPIAAGEFLDTLRRVNREIGTTILMTEHRLDEVLPLADRAVVMEDGRILADDTPANTGAILARMGHHMFGGMPAPLQAYGYVYAEGYGRDLTCPLNPGEGRRWLSDLLEPAQGPEDLLVREIGQREESQSKGPVALELGNVWFRYEKNGADVLKGLTLSVSQGEIYCIVGGNGTGKTTALSMMAGLIKPMGGKVRFPAASAPVVGMLPQNTQTIFSEKTLEADLKSVLPASLSEMERNYLVMEMAVFLEIEGLLSSHPFDISGGEQQRAALGKILLRKPDLILLDEPTKGMDSHFKERFAGLLGDLAEQGHTIVMVSHDIEFCSKAGDRCAMFFDGGVTTVNTPRKFFSGNSFYTTAANRMSRHLFQDAVTPKDVAALCLANLKGESDPPSKETEGPQATRLPLGATGKQAPSWRDGSKDKTNGLTFLERHRKVVKAPFLCLFPGGLGAALFLQTEGAYMIGSLMMILGVLAVFYLSFESRKPQAREVVLIAVMIALAVVSRSAFFMLPQFKPILAVIILSGACLGSQNGFVVGSMSAFVSNFLFGQGPWTPFQMLAWGLIGLFAGMVGRRMAKGPSPVALSIYGVFAVFLLHGGITDLWTLLGMAGRPTIEMVLTVYGTGFVFNTILAGATVIFLILFTRPVAEKIDRIRNKYGLFAENERMEV